LGYYQRYINNMSDLQDGRALTKGDIEAIERIVYKSSGDIAEVIGRSFERLEERIDGAESRIYSRLADLEDKIQEVRREEATE